MENLCKQSVEYGSNIWFLEVYEQGTEASQAEIYPYALQSPIQGLGEQNFGPVWKFEITHTNLWSGLIREHVIYNIVLQAKNIPIPVEVPQEITPLPKHTTAAQSFPQPVSKPEQAATTAKAQSPSAPRHGS